MNEENEKRLFKDFPSLYRGGLAVDKESRNLMAYGFSSGDGWFRLIHDLSAAIEQEAYAAGLKPSSMDWPMALQVKEKFGTLRFYVSTQAPGDGKDMGIEAHGGMLSFRPVASNERIRALVNEAEEKSASTCEDCGLLGTLRKTSWLHVACDECEAKRVLARAG
jgi:hypothetical protein